MNEQQIRDALRGVAEAPGRPDEAAAWERISGAIARDATAGRRRRALLGGAGLAIAGAAAAFAIVAGTGNDEEAVEIGPATESTTTTVAPATTTSTTVVAVEGAGVEPEVLGALPEQPLAVVVQLEPEGIQRLDLYDADTGEVVVRGLAESFFSISDVSVLEGGTVVYSEELGDSSTVRLVPWDGSAEPITPFGLEADMRAGTFSPDGTLFAFVEQGVERPQGRIGIVTAGDTGSIRYLDWADDEDDFFRTSGRLDDLEFSPDGTRLAFVVGYEGDSIEVVDVDAGSLSDATAVPMAAGTSPAWLDDGRIAYAELCCYPEFTEPRPVVLSALDASTRTELTTVEASAVAVAGERLVVVTDDGRVLVLDTFEAEPRPLAVTGAVDLGL